VECEHSKALAFHVLVIGKWEWVPWAKSRTNVATVWSDRLWAATRAVIGPFWLSPYSGRVELNRVPKKPRANTSWSTNLWREWVCNHQVGRVGLQLVVVLIGIHSRIAWPQVVLLVKTSVLPDKRPDYAFNIKAFLTYHFLTTIIITHTKTGVKGRKKRKKKKKRRKEWGQVSQEEEMAKMYSLNGDTWTNWVSRI
jgi:hypothetical protein